MIGFSFNGQSSSEYGVYLRSRPDIPTAERDIETIDIPGAAKPLIIDHGGYKAQNIEIEAYINNDTHLDAVRGWLAGYGEIIFASEPERAYHIYITGDVEYEHVSRTLKSKSILIPCTLMPFRYVYPAPSAVTISESGGTIENPGTVFSQPKLRITGSGDFTVVVNGYSMDGREISGGAIVDCELQETFTLDETQSLNSSFVMDEFPVLRPGTNIITWSGDVTQIEITPRWRYL